MGEYSNEEMIDSIFSTLDPNMYSTGLEMRADAERILANHDRAVAANAWDEADARLTEWHESKKGHWDNESRPGYRIWVEHPKPTNPYRITEENN